jgi:hypothetical protein
MSIARVSRLDVNRRPQADNGIGIAADLLPEVFARQDIVVDPPFAPAWPQRPGSCKRCLRERPRRVFGNVDRKAQDK